MNSLLSFRLQGLGADALDVRIRDLRFRLRAQENSRRALDVRLLVLAQP